jgi:NAD(P)-dependent dehydrogenase (short-subunit alcohol dehydrogenase family)
MVNRKEEQGDEAIEKIEKEAKEKGTDVKVEWVGCDFGDLKNVKEVFDGLRERLDRLDLVGGPPVRDRSDSRFPNLA